MPGSAELRIASTWSGEPIGPDELATVVLAWDEGGLTLEVDAPFHDDPPPSSERLWEHEVVEVFVAGRAQGYTEVELSPHGQYLVIRFEGYRIRSEFRLAIKYDSKVDGRRWTGRAVVPRGLLPAPPWRVNAYAIHGDPRRYLAWSPGTGPPDFHQLESFRPLA